MRIGIDARLWRETGVGRYIRNLVRELQTIDTENEYVLFVTSETIEEVTHELNNHNFQVVRSDIRWHSIAEQLYFPRLLKKAQLDLMHFPYFSLPILYTGPFVITVHDLIIHHFPTGKASTLPLPLYKIKHTAYKSVITQAVWRAKKVIVPLYATKQDMIRTLHVPSEKIKVTYEGVDNALLHASEGLVKEFKLTNKYFLYVGNAYPHKNLDTLLSAFQQFEKSRGLGITLVFVGKEDFFYKKLAEKIKIEKISSITLLHSVNDEQLVELYKNALAVITPSFMEGFGLVPLEALANGCPVIASDIPAHREVCGDAAMYFHPKDSSTLQSLLFEVCQMKDSERTKYHMKGLKRLPLFSWTAMAKETLAEYNHAIHKDNGRYAKTA